MSRLTNLSDQPDRLPGDPERPQQGDHQPGEVLAAALSADGKFLLTGDKAKTVRLWDTAENKQLRDFPGATAEITAVAISPNGAYVLASAADGSLRGWNLADAKPLGVTYGPPRPGDPPVLIASPDKIMRDLGWNPRHSELDRIIESAWRWHLAHPNGYEG